jgi:hypothetical protein
VEIPAGGLHGEGEHRFDSHLVFTEKIFKERFKVHTFEVVALLFTAPITCLFCSMAYQLETRLVIQCFWLEPILVCYFLGAFKGNLTQDFELQVFFINQCPPDTGVLP